jgi:hypothetical protein
MRRFWCSLIVICLAGPVCAEDPQVPTTVVSEGEISWWVGELDSDVFDTRERAQKNLIQAGDAALPAVTEAARCGSLETSTRAVNILLAWAESEDNDLVIAALENLVGMDKHPKQAKAAEERLFYVREYLALKEFEQLGGVYQIDIRTRNIMPLHRMQNLQVIIGSEWKGSIEGLKLLESMPHATTVSFHSPPLGDEALAILERVPQLRSVELFGTTRMTEAAIAAIQEKLAGVNFDRRSGAFLGVQSAFGHQAEVGHVVKGSAADVAGIKPGDTITKFEGQEIKDFRELTGMIAKYEPGDTVTLTVLRQPPNGLPEMLDLKVTFAQWGKNGAGELDNIPELNRVLPGGDFEPAKIQLDRR